MSSTETDAMDTTAPVVPQKSLWEDILDVYFSPTELFRRRANSSVTPPMIALLVLATVFYYILLPAQGIIQRAAMPPEVLAKAGGALKIMSIAGGIVVPIVVFILTAITAGLLWGIARLVDAKPDFHQMMVVATYAGFIGILAQIATAVAAMVHGEEGLIVQQHLSFGVMHFMDYKTLPKALVALLSRIDIFKIWQAVIWMIGFQVVTGVSRSKAAIVAGGTWLLFAVPGIVGSSAAGKLGNVEIKTGS